MLIEDEEIRHNLSQLLELDSSKSGLSEKHEEVMSSQVKPSRMSTVSSENKIVNTACLVQNMERDKRPYRAERQKRDPDDNYKRAKVLPRPSLSINNAKPTVPQPDAYFPLKSSHQSQGKSSWTSANSASCSSNAILPKPPGHTSKMLPISLHYTLLFPAV